MKTKIKQKEAIKHYFPKSKNTPKFTKIRSSKAYPKKGVCTDNWSFEFFTKA